MVSYHSQEKKHLKNTVVQRENAYLYFAAEFFVSEEYFSPAIDVPPISLFLLIKIEFQHSADVLRRFLVSAAIVF